MNSFVEKESTKEIQTTVLENLGEKIDGKTQTCIAATGVNRSSIAVIGE